jgi:hypothetical protein
MTRRQKILAGSLGAASLVLAAVLLVNHLRRILEEHDKMRRLVSCTSHGMLIAMDLRTAARERANWELSYLPYLTNQPGYKIFAAHHGTSLQCHHGGWQVVNLSPETWDYVFMRWKQRHPKADVYDLEIPLFWCGRPTDQPYRAVTAVNRHNSSRKYSLARAGMSDADLVRVLSELNEILSELDQPAISLDIPEDIDWLAVQSWASNAVHDLPSSPAR